MSSNIFVKLEKMTMIDHCNSSILLIWFSCRQLSCRRSVFVAVEVNTSAFSSVDDGGYFFLHRLMKSWTIAWSSQTDDQWWIGSCVKWLMKKTTRGLLFARLPHVKININYLIWVLRLNTNLLDSSFMFHEEEEEHVSYFSDTENRLVDQESNDEPSDRATQLQRQSRRPTRWHSHFSRYERRGGEIQIKMQMNKFGRLSKEYRAVFDINISNNSSNKTSITPTNQERIVETNSSESFSP